jgi:GNAT superfamily N-acetyltransferase
VDLCALPDGEAIVAVARFVRQPADPSIAEFAIVVGDRWEGQGLGRELLGRLADAAVTRGVERFRAAMLADNARSTAWSTDSPCSSPIAPGREACPRWSSCCPRDVRTIASALR